MQKTLKLQVSESMAVGLLLAFTGGFLDAYTYVLRGGVFANAQTGNIVMLGIHFFEGHYAKTLQYLIPISAFVLGVIVSQCIRSKFRFAKIHWRQLILLLESVVLCGVAFVPTSANALANAAVAFVCSLQVDAFRKLNGNPYATTMCTGNLRSAAENLYHYGSSHKGQSLYTSLQYFSVIGVFIVGAGVGAFFSQRLGLMCILIAPVVLLITILLMLRSHTSRW